MTDPILANHLLAAHPGVHAPWFTRSGYLLQRMTPEQLQRLHLELVRQGERCENRVELPLQHRKRRDIHGRLGAA